MKPWYLGDADVSGAVAMATLAALPSTYDEALGKAEAAIEAGRRVLRAARKARNDVAVARAMIQAVAELGWLAAAKVADSIILVDSPDADLSRIGHEDRRVAVAADIILRSKGYGTTATVLRSGVSVWHAQVFYRDDDTSAAAVGGYMDAIEVAMRDVRRWRKGRR